MTPSETVSLLEQNNIRVAVQFVSGCQAGRCYYKTSWIAYTQTHWSDRELMDVIPHGQEFAVTKRERIGHYAVSHVTEATDSSD